MTFGLKFILFVLSINAITFLAFWFDKKAAKQNRSRVPEKTLLLLSLFGGSPAAIFASQKFRHKTKKQPFKSILYFIIFLQILGIVLYFNNPQIFGEIEAYIS